MKKLNVSPINQKSKDDLLAEVEEAKAIANNAIYFDDKSDYRSALLEICHILGMDYDNIGVEFIEPIEPAE